MHICVTRPQWAESSSLIPPYVFPELGQHWIRNWWHPPGSNSAGNTQDCVTYYFLIYVRKTITEDCNRVFVYARMALTIHSISQEICTRFLFCCALLWLYIDWFSHWHCGNLTIAPVPAKQPWWICLNTSCEFIMNDCITTTKQSTTKPCAYFLGYTVRSLVALSIDIYVAPPFT